MQIFDDNLFEEFKNNLNSNESIVEFMEKTGLDTSGHNGNFYKCIFHNDKTPSLSINDKKGVFKCFSCGRGGRYFDFVFQYNKIILGYKKSQKEFANELIQKNKSLRIKYNIESLDKRIKFSEKTIEYMLEVQNISRKNKRKLAETILHGNESVLSSARMEIEKRIKETKDIDEVVLLFSDIQKGIIEID